MQFIQKIAISTLFCLFGCATFVGPGNIKPVKDHRTSWITIAVKPQESYDFVRYKVADLGFTGHASLGEIQASASLHGLDACPEPLGILIRQEYYDDQPVGEVLYLGMKEVMSRGKTPSIYRILIDNGHHSMDTVYVGGGRKFDPDSEFIFVRRKP